MKRRPGASLLNVMVFMMFSVMITAQVFFFAKTSMDSVSEERELMMYRLNLDSLVEVAKSALKTNEIVRNTRLDNTGGALKFSDFYKGARAKKDSYGNTDWQIPSEWEGEGYKGVYSLDIYDLDYSFDKSEFDRDKWIEEYSGEYMYKKPFASMLPLGREPIRNSSGDIILDSSDNPVLSPIRNRFFLIRAWTQLPENYYGRKLMYQVLVSRDEPNHNRVDTLSFQEVWF